MLHEGKTYEEYLELVKEKGLSLAFVPDEYRTYELCLEAIKVNPNMNIDCVPDKHKTYELCFEVVKNSFLNRILSIIPDKHRTYELCLEAVKRSPINIQYVPFKHRTYELCLETLKQCKIREGKELYFNYYIPDNIIKEISEKNYEFKTISHYKYNPENEQYQFIDIEYLS